jgi:hypothetical protein
MDIEPKRLWMEVGVFCLKVLSQYLPEGTDENHVKP